MVASHAPMLNVDDPNLQPTQPLNNEEVEEEDKYDNHSLITQRMTWYHVTVFLLQGTNARIGKRSWRGSVKCIIGSDVSMSKALT
jgi:hypothetical protein